MFSINKIFGIKSRKKEEKKAEKHDYVVHMPWIEKYRPKRLKDIIYQDEVKLVACNIIKTGQLPHLLLYGPPGTGKTSMILAMARHLFGPEIYRERVLELNASDERGINTVREKILRFAQMSIGRKDDRFPSPPFKIIILDEADAMTTDAQMALRKIMEDHSATTRMCLICNYVNKIIDSIISRCAGFRFKPLNDESLLEKITDICEREEMDVSDNAKKLMIKYSHGDMRHLISMLQNIKYTYGGMEKKIKSHIIYDITNSINNEQIANIINDCIDANTSYGKLISMTKSLIASGIDVSNLTEELIDTIAQSDTFDDKQKSIIAFAISNCDIRLFDGSDEYIQLLDILVTINNVHRKIITTVQNYELV